MKIKPYSSTRGNTSIKDKDLKTAVHEADTLLPLTDAERLETCSYVDKMKKTDEKSDGATKNTTVKRRKRKVPCSLELESHTMEGVSDLASLKNFFSENSIDFEKFIQTNFKLGPDGMVRLSTAQVPPSQPLSVKKKRVGKGNGRKKKSGQHEAGKKDISPTLTDYFSNTIDNNSKDTSVSSDREHPSKKHKSLTYSSEESAYNHVCATSQSLKDNLVLRNKCSKPIILDQVVPPCESDLFDAEIQALRELEEIEGMLGTINEVSSAQESDHKEPRGRNKLEDDVCHVKEGCDDGINSMDKQLHLLLGEIDEIDGELYM